MFDLLAHADWSIAAKKRWVSIARRVGGQWQVEAPEVVSDCASFVSEVVAGESHAQRRLIGFDFPIGVPAGYGARTGFQTFRNLLESVGADAWDDFFNVAVTREQISLRRPFYPQRSNDGAKRFHLLEALEVESIDELLRQCERRTADRNAACSLFWTLGAQQVGKAAISGWREVIRPALARGVRLWPFDGRLRELSEYRGSVICETYPAEAYGHVGIRFGPAESKRRQIDRASKAPAILAWATPNHVVLSEAASNAVQNGFGPNDAGEDAFDSLVGLLGVIEVVDGRRGEGPTEEADIQRWEGWILGQQPSGESRYSNTKAFLHSGTQISAFGGSRIPRATIEAYLATEYRISGEWPLVLRIGQPSEQLRAIYRKRGVKSAAVLTAWNPYSEPRSAAENETAQRRLVFELDRLGLNHQPGQGADPTGKWPPEDSRFVLGLDFATATSLGTKFEQNGIVWIAADTVPRLVVVR